MFDVLRHLVPLTRYPYRGERVACPVCADDGGERVADWDRRLKRLPTFACAHCGLLYTNPMPTEAELDDYYTRLYRFDYQAAVDAPKQKHIRKRIEEANRRAGRLTDLLAPGARTLDFGCGSGEFVTAMRDAGHEAHGFEPGRAYGNHARSLHGDRVQVRGWQDVSFDEPFDLVSCFHVLEHLRDPIAALRRMAEWTAPGGLIYVEVPNLGAIERHKGFGRFHFAHLIGFNHHNLLLAGALSGLEPKAAATPTGVIFERREDRPGLCLDQDEAARRGRELTHRMFGEGGVNRRYLRYQLRKLSGGRLAAA